MLGKEEAERILKDIEAARGNPMKVIEIITKAGEAGGFNAMSIFTRLQAERKPNETIEQVFKRMMVTEENKS